MVPLQRDGVHTGGGVPARSLAAEGLREREGGVGGRLWGRPTVSRGLVPVQVGEGGGVIQLQLAVREVMLIVCELKTQSANSGITLDRGALAPSFCCPHPSAFSFSEFLPCPILNVPSETKTR